MIRLLTLTVLLSVAVASFAVSPRQDSRKRDGQDSRKRDATQKQEEKKQDKKMVLPGQDPDAVARRDFMRTKMLFTQNIFNGLTIGDFDLINRSIKEVQGITEGEKWVSIKNEQYQKLTEEFKTATRRLATAAKTRNIEATALRFYELSTSCIDCHQHIRNADYEY